MPGSLRLFRIAIFKIREGWLILHMVLIGVPAWFALVLSDGTNFNNSQAFFVMSNLMDEQHWSAVSGIVAILCAFGWGAKTFWMHVGASFLLTFWYVIITVCFFLSIPLGTAGGTYFLLTLAAVLELIARVYDRNRFHA